ncbi:MAG: hypothetical protein KME15_26390 [Drouetiella hepatica Uher 2000/2452]|jgi:hypothetical protein|uniref:Uncharacterized protein n=1 Tax=Drouetiella hepatica Uher 2000/2452 TaxID=904376 RepID=A0A951UQ26_9CYAN|nr:hypothetical protein [Drouetiella hepatica Uher 2000/2452]
MIRVLGLIAAVTIVIRFLSDGIFTIDVQRGADVLRDVGGYTLTGNSEGNEQRSGLRVPYNPSTGRVGNSGISSEGDTPLNSPPRVSTPR